MEVAEQICDKLARVTLAAARGSGMAADMGDDKLARVLAKPQQVVEGQCGTCGATKPPEDMYRFWFTRVITPPGMEGTTLVCDDCKMLVMAILQHMPDRGPAPLKGYT